MAAAFPTAEELLAALNEPHPSLETLEAAVDYLAAHRFSIISAKLFRLADLVREKLSREDVN
jgi:hypothetical protein